MNQNDGPTDDEHRRHREYQVIFAKVAAETGLPVTKVESTIRMFLRFAGTPLYPDRP